MVFIKTFEPISSGGLEAFARASLGPWFGHRPYEPPGNTLATTTEILLRCLSAGQFMVVFIQKSHLFLNHALKKCSHVIFFLLIMNPLQLKRRKLRRHSSLI